MKSIPILILLSLLSLLVLPSTSFATIDNDAAKVLLRTSCTEAGATLNNCFENVASLQDWIANTRIRSASDPLSVEIGPGTFNTPQFNCQDSGYITLRGSGQQATTIRSTAGYVFSLASECNFNVSDLTIQANPQGFGAVNLVAGSGGTSGNTTWTNVDVIAYDYGWEEATTECGTHYWIGSRITVYTGASTGAPFVRGYTSKCGQSWFFSSQIIAEATENGTNEAVTIVSDGGEVHVYGGNIRAIADTGVSTTPADKGTSTTEARGLVAIANNGGTIHLHGTGIDVISAEANDIAGIVGWNNSFTHANGSAYAVKTGTGGKITRLMKYDTSTISAPYLWGEGTTPPGITSVDGSDLAVETNCSSSGCQASGSEPHLLIYNKSQCTGSGGPWFDIVTHACR